MAGYLQMQCPHCDTRAKVRTSRSFEPLSKELRYVCENGDCLHSFVVEMKIVKTIHQSLSPRAGVDIPLSDRTRAA